MGTVPRMLHRFKVVRIVMITGALYFMCSSYAQSVGDLDRRLNQHLLIAERKDAHVEDIDRRVAAIESTTRADRLDLRIARIEATADSLKTMFFGMAVPVLLIGIEALRRLVSESKRVREPA